MIEIRLSLTETDFVRHFGQSKIRVIILLRTTQQNVYQQDKRCIRKKISEPGFTGKNKRLQKMKKIILAALVIILSSTQCFAWTMKIKTKNFVYEGRPLANEMIYTIKGKTVGSARQLGNEIIYLNEERQNVGSVSKLGNDWRFKDQKGTVIGSATMYGNELVYKDARGKHIGYASVFGSKTEYKTGNHGDMGSADTDTMPLRPIPLEMWLEEKASTSVCLTVITGMFWDKGAAGAGLRAGDILIGFENENGTTLDFLKSDCQKMHSNVSSFVQKNSKKDDLVMIVYRPQADENGKATGKILRTAPTSSGKRGYTYTTLETGPSFSRANSISYAEQIKKIYQTDHFENAEVSLPSPDSVKKDTRNVPEAHQELREELINGKAVTLWVWVNDQNGRVMSEETVSSRLKKESMKGQNEVSIKSYPGAKIFVSTTDVKDDGDPAVSTKFKYIGSADSRGMFRYSGRDVYTLPQGTKALAFSASILNVDMAEVEKHPMITSLPENTLPQMRDAVIQQVISMKAQELGLKPEIRFGYVEIAPGKTSYELKQN